MPYTLFRPSPNAECDDDASLCKSCQELVIELLHPDADASLLDNIGANSLSKRPHHETKAALVTSATECGLCRLILYELRYHIDCVDYTITIDHKQVPSLSIRAGNESSSSLSGVSLVQVAGGLEEVLKPSGSGYRDRKFLIQGNGRNPVINVVPEAYPTTRENVSTAQAWMATCDNDHSSCRLARREDRFLPKRVLNITSPTNVILYEPGREEVAPYAALSYCWGASGVPLITTNDNIRRHRSEGIPLSSFPETIRDAIRLAGALDFAFIWIDALCIVQDDPVDWAYQATAMTNIYEGCKLNIAVSDSPDSNAGVTRRVCNSLVRVGRITGDGDIEMGIYAMPKNLCPPGISYKYDNCHLATRGWVFQETLVSTTSLYLTHQGLAWDCCTERSREGGGDPQPAVDIWPYPSGTLTNKASWAQHNRKWLADRSGSNICEDPDSPVDELRVFHQWVLYASRRNLSKPTDKLPSLAGIASRLTNATSSSYVAGLFREDLVVGLTWLVDRSGTITTRQDRAPTWSWASIDGPINYLWCLLPGGKYPALIEADEALDLVIHNVSVSEVRPGTLGEVQGGHIEATGALWKRGSDDNVNGMEWRRAKVLWDEDRPLPPVTWILYLVSVLANGASEKRRGPYPMFLILEETGKEDEFRRVGMAYMDQSPRWLGWAVPAPLIPQMRKKIRLV